MLLGEHDVVLSNGDVKTPDGVWRKKTTSTGLHLSDLFEFQPNDVTKYYSALQYRNALIVRLNGDRKDEEATETYAIVNSMGDDKNSYLHTAYLYSDTYDSVDELDVSKVVPRGATVQFKISQDADFYNKHVDAWTYDAQRGVFIHKWDVNAKHNNVRVSMWDASVVLGAQVVPLNTDGTMVAVPPKPPVSPARIQLQWLDNNHDTAYASVPLGVPCNNNNQSYIPTFSVDGQPRGAVIENEDWNVTLLNRLPGYTGFTIDRYGNGDSMRVPGEGTWHVAFDDVTSRKSGECHAALTFEPKKGFSGTPSPIRYGMLDTLGYAPTIGRLVSDEGSNEPAKLYDAFWGKNGYSPDLPISWERAFLAPFTAYIDGIVGPNETLSTTIIEIPKPRTLTVDKNQPAPAPQSGISNFNTYPKGTTVTWTKAPSTATAGTTQGEAVVKLPGGETYNVTIPVSVLGVAPELHITDVKKLTNGDYKVTRNDGKTWTIQLTDLRNKIAALENNQSPTAQDFEKVKDALNKAQASVKNLEQTTNTKFDAVNTELQTLTSNLDRVEGLTIASIVADGKGGYKLKRNNGEMVAGTIDTTTGSITNVASDGKGNITVTIDGEQRTVPLDKVRITEANKGTPQHTVTLTVPGGKSVTFNVFDNYVTDVKKNAQGNYDIYRSDVAGGKTVWKTIDLADLRAQIAALEQKQSPTAQEFNAVREQLREYETLLQSSTTQLRGDVDALRSDLSNITGRVDGIEARLSTVEARQDAWAKCYSGAAMAAIPAVGITLVALISQAHIPGIAQANTNLQQQLGIYRPELMSSNGNAHLHTAAQIAPIIAGVAGLLGAIAYAANACKEYNQTQAVQNTPFGKLNAQLGSSK